MSVPEHSIVGAGLVPGNWDTDEWPVNYDPGTDDFIHPRTRRRMSRLSCMAVTATRMAGGREANGATPLVFATANGEINTIGIILESIADPDRSVSPTHFHNSVHNAGPGYWAITAGRKSPTTTLSMGELTFESAMLDAWARLLSGTGEVQVTAGDEAITGPRWADPGHCTHDLCGSLMLASGRREGALGSLVHVGLKATAGPEEVKATRRELFERYEPTEVVADFSCSGGEPGPALPSGATNPCGGVYFVSRFLMDPERGGRLLLLKTGRYGDLATMVVGKGGNA